MDDIVTKEAQNLINDWLKRTEVCLNINDNSVSTTFVTKEWKQLPKITKQIPKVVKKTQMGKNDSLQEEVHKNFIIKSVDQLVDKNKIAKKVVAAFMKAEEAYDPNVSMGERHRLIIEKRMIREMEHKKRYEEMKRREEIRAEALKLLEQEERMEIQMKFVQKKVKTKKNIFKHLKEKEEQINQNEEDLLNEKMSEQIMDRKQRKEDFIFKLETEALEVKRNYFKKWKKMIEEGKLFAKNANHVYSQKLLWKHLMLWKKHALIDQIQVLQLADQYRISTLLSHSFAKWKDFTQIIKTKVKEKKINKVNKKDQKSNALEKLLESQRCQIKAQQKLIHELKLAHTVAQERIQQTNNLLIVAKNNASQINVALDEPIDGRPISEDSLENKVVKQFINNLRCHDEIVNQKKQSKSFSNIVCNNRNERVIQTLRKSLKLKSSSLTDNDIDDIDHTKPIEDIIKEELKSILTSASSHQKSIINSQHSKFIKDMERRNMEREKVKKERKDKKRNMEDEKFVRLQQEVAEKKKVEDDMKKKMLLEIKERKMAEKEREMKKKLAEERLKDQIKKAENARRFLLTKYRGWNPWIQFIQLEHDATRRAHVCYDNHLMRRIFTAWRTRAKDELETRESVANLFGSIKLTRKYFHMWLEFHVEQVQKSEKACQHYENIVTIKLFKRWFLETKSTKNLIDSRMAEAQNNHNNRLLHKHMNAWKLFLIILEKERTREARLEHLRNKISQVIPDFSPNAYSNTLTL